MANRVALAIAGMAVLTTMLKAVNELVREIGTQRSLGFRRRHVLLLFAAVITDFLQKEGFFLDFELGGERRLFPRKKIILPAVTILKSGSKTEIYPGVILTISRGGVLLTYARRSEMQFTSRGELPHFRLCSYVPQNRKELCFDCLARPMRETGEEIQVGASFTDPSEESLQMLASYLI